MVQLMEGGTRGASYPLKDGDNLVGREAGDIVFPTDGFVSSSHATLHVATDRVLIRDGIRDKHSSNGTFLRLTAPAFVENGDQFLIGRQLVRVEMN